jgi:hypothetical protein
VPKQIDATNLLRYLFEVARWTLNENNEAHGDLSFNSMGVVNPKTTLARALPTLDLKNGGLLIQAVFLVDQSNIKSIVVYLHVSKALGVFLVPTNFVSISCVTEREDIILVNNFSVTQREV